MSYSPQESTWLIQDLDTSMMYPPQDRAPAYHINIKTETPMDRCPPPPSCMMAPSNGGGYSTPYPGSDGTNNNTSFTGEWPSDLDNIHLDCSLPTEAESPLKLEDYNMTKFVFVDPSTQSPSPVATTCSNNSFQQSPVCSPMKYSTPPPPHDPMQRNHQQPTMYYEQPMATLETLQPEATPVDHHTSLSIPQNQCQGRPIGRRGRPRTEWRINKRGPGRPRAKPGRKPILGVVKTEPDDEENMYPDPCEEKRERRREQNRRAARKLREKKKVHVEHMRQNYDHVLSENRRLGSEVAKLKQIVSELKAAKSNHVCMCSNSSDAYTPSPSSVTSHATSAYVSGSDSIGSSYHESPTSTMTSSHAPSGAKMNLMNELVQMER